MALLSAPEWPRVPDGLRRANGDSVFRPPGAELYAAQSQISLEERLMSDTQAPAAAAWYLLTSPRRAEVMTGPAGSG